MCPKSKAVLIRRSVRWIRPCSTEIVGPVPRTCYADHPRKAQKLPITRTQERWVSPRTSNCSVGLLPFTFSFTVFFLFLKGSLLCRSRIGLYSAYGNVSVSLCRSYSFKVFRGLDSPMVAAGCNSACGVFARRL